MKPGKDKLYEPVISKNECLAGLRLAGHIMDRIAEQGTSQNNSLRGRSSSLRTWKRSGFIRPWYYDHMESNTDSYLAKRISGRISWA